jgi:hypothetical protein
MRAEKIKQPMRLEIPRLKLRALDKTDSERA